MPPPEAFENVQTNELPRGKPMRYRFIGISRQSRGVFTLKENKQTALDAATFMHLSPATSNKLVKKHFSLPIRFSPVNG